MSPPVTALQCGCPPLTFLSPKGNFVSLRDLHCICTQPPSLPAATTLHQPPSLPQASYGPYQRQEDFCPSLPSAQFSLVTPPPTQDVPQHAALGWEMSSACLLSL